uniref:Uncharacterized protein n=1 Tax=Helianthus annuus TaxID=4232 RepID=A0A251V7S8_HELAN
MGSSHETRWQAAVSLLSGLTDCCTEINQGSICTLIKGLVHAQSSTYQCCRNLMASNGRGRHDNLNVTPAELAALIQEHVAATQRSRMRKTHLQEEG